MHDAVIVSAVRTASGKAPGGTLRGTRPDELAATAIAEALKRAQGIAAGEIDDVIMGCAMPEAEQGMNVARIASLRAGIPVSASAVTVNRFCSSGLQSIAYAAERIMCGSASVIVAGGTESMSLVPMGGIKIAPNPTLIDRYPDVYLSTGLVAENHAREAGISRAEQDAFALRSHQRALAAIDSGAFAREIVPVQLPDGTLFTTDEGPRRETSLEALAALQPAFIAGGSVTAGNSSPLNDGASGVVLMSAEKARDLGIPAKARIISMAVAGVAPEVMGIGPVKAVTKALARANLQLADIDIIELNEAFAAQSLAVIRELGIDEERLNPHGGAIALGHPLGCTGARLIATLLNDLETLDKRLGMATLCVGGGQGVATIIERL
jgi:acetyl-CoA acetyltransferase family protein